MPTSPSLSLPSSFFTPSSLLTPYIVRPVDFLDSVTFLLTQEGGGNIASSAAVILADIDGDPYHDNELVIGSSSGTLSIFKGSQARPICALNGFGSIVAIRHESVPGMEAKEKEKNTQEEDRGGHIGGVTHVSTRSSERLLIANAEGDVFVLEIHREKFAETAAKREAAIMQGSEQEEPGAQLQQPTLEEDAQLYSQSPLVRSYARFRIPLNVTVMEWLDLDDDGEPELVLATSNRSLHAYSLHLERDAEELALEAAEAQEALLTERAREDARIRMMASPVLGATGKRASITAALGGMGAPVLGASTSSSASSAAASKDSSPALRGRNIPGQPQLPQPVSTSTNNSPLLTSSFGRRSPLISGGPGSAGPTRTGSPMTGPILNAINAPPQASSASPTPTSMGASPASRSYVPSSTVRSRAEQTWHVRLALKKQLLHVPLAIHAVTGVSSRSALVNEALSRNDSESSLSSLDTSSSSTKPSSSTPSLLSNFPALIPVQLIDSQTWHVLPCQAFVRHAHHKHSSSGSSGSGTSSAPPPAGSTSFAQGTAHQRAPSHTGLVNPAHQSLTHAASSASLVNLHASGSSRDVVAGFAKEKEQGTPSLLSKSVGRLSGPLFALTAAREGAGSRKNSGATPIITGVAGMTSSPALTGQTSGSGISMFHSPHLIMGPSSSPKYGPMSVTNSPRFGFPIGTVGAAGSSLYSNSVSASPGYFSSNPGAPGGGGMPSFSLGTGALSVDSDPTAPPTSFQISPTVLIVSLDLGALMVDLVNGWCVLLRLPRITDSPSLHPVPSTSSVASRDSASSAALSERGAHPSASPPSQHQALARHAVTSPTRSTGFAVGTSHPAPPLQRTSSAPGIAHLDSAPGAPGIGGGTSVLSPPPPTTTHGLAPHSQSGSSTPVLRAAGARRQPSGINLSALDPAGGSAVELPSPGQLKLHVTGGGVLPGTGMETPFFSPSGATTPHMASLGPSRSASSAALNGLLAGSSGAGAGGAGNTTSSHHPSHISELVRCSLVGDVPLPNPSGESPSPPSGVLAVLDSLGRFHLTLAANQLLLPQAMGGGGALSHSSSISDITQTATAANAESPAPTAPFNISFHLPGQFLSLQSLSILTPAGEAQSLLVACSLDGCMYFIPTLPAKLPPLPPPDAPAPVLPGLPLVLTKAQLPTRVQAFHCGLYSFTPGAAVPVVLLASYHGAVTLFADVVQAAGMTQWDHAWAWRKAEPQPAEAMTRPPSGENLASKAEGGDPSAVASSSAEDLAPLPAFELVPRSVRRTVLQTWMQSDRELAEIQAAARSAEGGEGGEAQVEEDVSLQTLLEFTSSQTSIPPAQEFLKEEEDAAPYLRDLKAADLTILNAYRDKLRRMLGIVVDDTEARGDEQFLHRSRASSSDVEDDIAELRSIGGATPPAVGETQTGSPLVSSFASHPLHSSPLFSPFKQGHHYNMTPPKLALGGKNSPTLAQSGQLPPPHRSTGQQSNPADVEFQETKSSFWRKLLRRTQ